MFDRVVRFLAAFVCVLAFSTVRDVRLRTGVVDLAFAGVARDATLKLRVTSEAGEPRRGASVRVFAQVAQKAALVESGATDETGSFVTARLPRTDTWVIVDEAGRSRATGQVSFHDVVLKELHVTNYPENKLEVLIVDSQDKPIEKATVEVTAQTVDVLSSVATSAQDGRVTIGALALAPYTVRAIAAGYEEKVVRDVAPARDGPVRVRLDQLAAAVVTVVDASGARVPGATVMAAGIGLFPPQKVQTDARGEVRFASLKPGNYDFRASLDDRVSATELGIAVARGEAKALTLTLEQGKFVQVQVRNGKGEGSTGIADANVVLAENGLSSFPVHEKTNSEGKAKLGPVRLVESSLSVTATNYMPALAVRVEASTSESEVVLVKGAVLVGRVLDDRDFPISGATIEVIGVNLEGMPISESSALLDFRADNLQSMFAPQKLLPVGELGVMPGPLPDLPRGDLPSLTPSLPVPVRHMDPWVTRADGTFRLEPVSPGRVQLIVRHPDFVETTTDLFSIAPAEERSLTVVLRRGGSLEGRVVEADGTPVPQARIVVAATRGTLERVGYSNSDGTFHFTSVPEEVLVSVSRADAPGEVLVQDVVNVPRGERKEIEVVLPTEREAIQVRVVDDRDYSLEGVQVRVVSLDLNVPLVRTVFSDKNGEFSIASAFDLPLQMNLTMPGKAPLIHRVDKAPREMRITLEESKSLRGEVRARRGGDRIDGAEVTLYTAAGAKQGRTDSNGNFTLSDLMPGRAMLTVFHQKYAPLEKWVTVANDSKWPTDAGRIELTEAGSVSGIVLDAEEKPVAGARVARDFVPTFLPVGPLPPGVVATDSEGRFALGQLPEGTVSLQAYFAELGRGIVDDVDVRSGETREDVTIVLTGEGKGPKLPRGPGSLALTLGERTEGGTRRVTIVMVPRGSVAEQAGVMPGDDLMAVNGKAVRSIEEAREKLTGSLNEDVILMLLREMSSGKREPWPVRVRRERVQR